MAVPSGRNGKSIVEYTSKQLSYALDRTRLKINFFILSINKHLHYVLNIYQYTDWEIIRTILASKNYTKIFFRRKNPTHRYLISETRDNIVPFSKTLAAKFDESNPTLEIVNIQNSKANSLQITVGIEVEKTIFAMGYGIGGGGKEGRRGSGLRASRLSVGARTMDPPWPHHVLT